MYKLISSFAKSLSTQAPIYSYHFPNGSVYNNPAVTAKRIIKVVGDRLRKIDPERWESTPITFNTNWNDAAGYVDVATCIHIHDALEKEFGIEVKDRAFLVSSIETAFYIVNIHHDSH
ncbi:unnamed protein product [Paramecium sonneborni]|uniref:Uncharacterized protein n=1 Tax=Paramecium sonneborni TaxID=65129 RepID=A0A8S1LLV8_9CILI|nr:unnamed protein product [Paramecium sonneborni]